MGDTLYFVPQLIKLLAEQKAGIPVVVGGSIITPGDRLKLAEMGVAAVLWAVVFGQGNRRNNKGPGSNRRLCRFADKGIARRGNQRAR